jgi:hypothetical protein
MEKKDPNDNELGIPSKNTVVVHAQSAVSVMMFSPTEHPKQPTSMAKT